MPPPSRCLALTVFLLLIGCGGGGGDGDSPVAPTPTVIAVTTPTPFATATALPIAFAAGGILASRSDDGAATWEPIFTPATTLHAIDFVDRQLGWAVGNANLYRTTVGGIPDGRAWEDQAPNVVPPMPDLGDVAFADANRGVAVGGTLFAPARRGPDILVTDDAGAQWRHADLDGLPPSFEGYLEKVCLSANRAGVCIGGRYDTGAPVLLTTATFGERWVARPIAGGVARLVSCFSDGDVAWVVGAPSAVLVTRDGGATWTRLALTAARENLYLSAVLFVDGARGWIAGYDPTAAEVLVFATTDGGATWTETIVLAGVGSPPGTLPAALAAFDDDSLVLVGTDPGGFPLDFARPFSFVTHDGGRTWSESLIPGGYYAFSDVDVVP